MSKGLPDTLILSVLHKIETFDPLKGQTQGMLIIGKESEIMFFKWCPYVEKDEIQVSYIHQLYLSALQIQKILIAPRGKTFDMVFSTLHPPEMHQFRITHDAIQTVTQFMQVLAVNSTIGKRNEMSADFWRNVAQNNASGFGNLMRAAKVYDIPCTNGVFEVPYIKIMTTDSIPLVDELSASEVATRFGVNGHIYKSNPLSVDDYNAIVSSSINLSDLNIQVGRKGLEHNLRAILWPRLLGVIPYLKDKSVDEFLRARVEEYEKIKNQWNTMSSYQTCKNQGLRNAYQTIRMDVRRTNIPSDMDEKEFKNIMLNVLKTYTLYNFDIRYTQGLNDVLLPFVYVFKSTGVKDVEALSFWCFASFLERSENALIDQNIGVEGMMRCDLPEIVRIAELCDPECGRWIIDNDLQDMNFMISPFMLVFRRSFDQEDVERIWDTAIASDNPRKFLLCFAAALLVFSYPSFKKIDHCSTSRILPICDQVFSKQPVGSVIGVAIQLMEKVSNIERRTPWHTEPVFETDYFKPANSEFHDRCLANELYV